MRKIILEALFVSWLSNMCTAKPLSISALAQLRDFLKVWCDNIKVLCSLLLDHNEAQQSRLV